MNQASRSGKPESPTPPNTAKKRPVAFLLPNLKGGGTQRAQLLIAQGAAEMGESVDLVVCRRVGSFAQDLPPRVRLIDLKGRTETFPLSPLVRYLRREEPNAIFSALNQANLLALVAVSFAKVDTKVIMAVQNHFGAKWRYLGTPTAPIRKYLFQWMYRKADRVVAVSASLRKYLILRLHLPPDKVVSIPNPVDHLRVQSLANHPVDHPWLINPASVPVVIATGRLDRQKDFVTLITAFHEVLNKKTAKLLILGEGPERSKLETLIQRLDLSEYVDLPGFQPNPYSWMAHSNLFVLSSLWEGYPLVLLEALTLGLNAISTDCESGPKEILPAECLAPVNDPLSLAQIILRVLEHGASNRFTPSLYEPKSVAASFLALLD